MYVFVVNVDKSSVSELSYWSMCSQIPRDGSLIRLNHETSSFCLRKQEFRAERDENKGHSCVYKNACVYVCVFKDRWPSPLNSVLGKLNALSEGGEINGPCQQSL